MVKRGCNFRDGERKALFSLYEIVKGLDQKMDHIIENQRDLYYSTKIKKWYGEDE